MQEYDLEQHSDTQELFQLPSPVKDVYEIGFDEHLVRTPFNEPGINPQVESNATQSNSSVTQYLNALEVEEYFQITHTTTAFSAGFRATTQHLFKDQQKKVAPAALAYLVNGTNYDTTYQALPFYEMGNTVGIDDPIPFRIIHKYSTRQRFIEIETRSPTAATFIYDIYILRDKFAREY